MAIDDVLACNVNEGPAEVRNAPCSSIKERERERVLQRERERAREREREREREGERAHLWITEAFEDSLRAVANPDGSPAAA